MAKFQGVDYYDIDALLTEEQRMIRDTVREWVDDNLLPVINDAYIGRYLPKQLIPGSSRGWRSWACSARTCRKSTAAPGWTTSPTA
jgi:hypothetical protein